MFGSSERMKAQGLTTSERLSLHLKEPIDAAAPPLGLWQKVDPLDHKRVTLVAAPVILKKEEHLQGLRMHA